MLFIPSTPPLRFCYRLRTWTTVTKPAESHGSRPVALQPAVVACQARDQCIALFFKRQNVTQQVAGRKITDFVIRFLGATQKFAIKHGGQIQNGHFMILK
jgi:hypothetical protein